MTQRKPGTVSWENWIEGQITEAQARGEFDNLPGAGKPIEDLDQADAMVWVAKKLRAEGVDPSVYLPPQLAIAREVEDLPATLARLSRETEVRKHIAELNERIRRVHVSPPPGPPVRVKLVDVETAVNEWHAARPTPAPAPPVARAPARSRWWRRGSRAKR